MKNLKNIGKVLLLFLGGGIIGYFIGGFIPKGSLIESGESISTAGKIGFVFIAIFLLFFVILWHELGHIVGGLLVGDKFGFLAVGPMWVEKEEEDLKWRWNKDFSTFGGLAFIIPQENGYSFKFKRSIMVAGGPIASLILAFITLGIAFTPQVGVYLDLVLKCCALTSFFIFLATIIPSKMGGFMSDGMQLLKVFQGDESAQQYQAFNQLLAQSYQGIPPREWDQENLSLATNSTNKSIAVSGNALAYYYHIDKGQIEEARDSIDRLIENISQYPKPFQGDLWMEICLFKIYFEKDWTFFEENKSKITPSAKKRNKFLNILLETVLAQKEGQIEDLEALKLEASTIKRTDGTSKFYRKLFNDMVIC